MDIDLHHGAPCIRGTRVSVATILGSLADGFDAGRIREAYPQLTDADIAATLAYTADVVQGEILLPFAA